MVNYLALCGDNNGEEGVKWVNMATWGGYYVAIYVRRDNAWKEFEYPVVGKIFLRIGADKKFKSLALTIKPEKFAPARDVILKWNGSKFVAMSGEFPQSMQGDLCFEKSFNDSEHLFSIGEAECSIFNVTPTGYRSGDLTCTFVSVEEVRGRRSVTNFDGLTYKTHSKCSDGRKAWEQWSTWEHFRHELAIKITSNRTSPARRVYPNPQPTPLTTTPSTNAPSPTNVPAAAVNPLAPNAPPPPVGVRQ
jgi:hypothetical protein